MYYLYLRDEVGDNAGKLKPEDSRFESDWTETDAALYLKFNNYAFIYDVHYKVNNFRQPNNFSLIYSS